MVGVSALPAIVSNHIYCYFRLGKKGIFFQLVCFILFGRACVQSVSLTVYIGPSHSARKK